MPIRILLADDHAVVRAGIAGAISNLPDIEIVGEVGDGTALLGALSELFPDCLLIDVTMPAFEPISDITYIHQQYPRLKILVVSAYDDDVYVQGLLGAGVDGYHLKDQPLDDLRLAVQRVLAGERWICSPLVDKLIRMRETPTAQLTERQRELLHYLLEGLDNVAITRRTGLSIKTVENHLTRLYRQLNVQSRLEAVSYMRQHAALLGIPGAAAHPAEEPVGGGIVILIVDDNIRYRTQLRRMIGRSYPGANIQEAENIQSAVRLAHHIQPRLALVDVVLGDESGIECTRALQQATPAVRIVLLSAYPDREFHHQGLQAGAVAFLDKKDVNAATLRALIDDLNVI
jgi:DNA-binding NarL/FixJ family response regulator